MMKLYQPYLAAELGDCKMTIREISMFLNKLAGMGFLKKGSIRINHSQRSVFTKEKNTNFDAILSIFGI